MAELTDLNLTTIYRPQEIGAETWEVRAMSPDASEVIGRVRLRRLYECSCIGVMFNLATSEAYRRQGIGKALLARLDAEALKHSMSLLIATVRTDNTASRSLLLQSGYVEQTCWHNPISGADLLLYVRRLNP